MRRAIRRHGAALARGLVHLMERGFHVGDQRGEIAGQGGGATDDRVVEAGLCVRRRR